MQNLQTSEFENETYVAPGTNFVLNKTWQRNLVDGLHPRNTGLHIYGDHYVSVQENTENNYDFKCVVHSAEFYVEINHHYQLVKQSGFVFFANQA